MGEPGSRRVLQALRRQAEKLAAAERWEAAGLVLGEALAELDSLAEAAEMAGARAELLAQRADCVTRVARAEAELGGGLGAGGGSGARARSGEPASQTAAFCLSLAAQLEAASCLLEAAAAYEQASALSDGAAAEIAQAKAIRLRAIARSKAGAAAADGQTTPASS